MDDEINEHVIHSFMGQLDRCSGENLLQQPFLKVACVYHPAVHVSMQQTSQNSIELYS